MFDAVFQALFAYRPIVFQQGDLRFNVTTGTMVAAVLVAVAAAIAIATYRRVRVNEGRTRDRVILTGLRLAALALVLFCLFRPTLVVRAAAPQQNVVAVLLDDSRSMQVPDWTGKPRAEFLRQQFGEESGTLLRALSERFQVRLFRFASTAWVLNLNDSSSRRSRRLAFSTNGMTWV